MTVKGSETRARFEKWATQESEAGYPFPLELARIGDTYKYSDTRFAYFVWQAALADTPAERPTEDWREALENAVYKEHDAHCRVCNAPLNCQDCPPDRQQTHKPGCEMQAELLRLAKLADTPEERAMEDDKAQEMLVAGLKMMYEFSKRRLAELADPELQKLTGESLEFAYAEIGKVIAKHAPVAAERAEEGWIRVDTKLPEVGWCLTWEKMSSGSVYVRWFRADRQFAEPRTIEEGGDLLHTYFVTHWRPLPAPPPEHSKEKL